MEIHPKMYASTSQFLTESLFTWVLYMNTQFQCVRHIWGILTQEVTQVMYSKAARIKAMWVSGYVSGSDHDRYACFTVAIQQFVGELKEIS